MDEFINLVIKSYGLFGVIIIAPYVAVVYLWKENGSLHKEVIAAKDQSTAAQAQRVDDAKQISNKLIEVFTEQSSQNREIIIALDRVREMVSMSHNTRALTDGRG